MLAIAECKGKIKKSARFESQADSWQVQILGSGYKVSGDIRHMSC